MILLDGRPLDGGSSVRGIGSYVRGLLAGFAELGRAGDIELLLADGQLEPREATAAGVRAAEPRLRVLHPTLQPLADPRLVRRAIRRVRPALYHAVEWGQPSRPGIPVVVTVHDLIPFVFPRDYPWVRRSHIPALRRLRRADHVITPSQATADDVHRLGRVAASRISVIAEGVSAGFAPPPEDDVTAVLERLGVQRPFVLAVGTFDPRKRIRLLAEVMARVRQTHDIRLVIAGDQGTFAATVDDTLRSAGVAEHAHCTGLVSRSDLVALYTAARCLVFTSAYEGFGLPPLEAMACGTPVAMFRNSSLPEVAGPASLVEPDGDAAAMVGALIAILAQDRTTHADDRRAWASRFTWRHTAAATLGVYEQILAQRLPM